MSKLAIRLALHGCTNRPFYHIVVMDKSKSRDSRPREQLGTYDPIPNSHGEKLVAFNFDRLKHWISYGAEPTDPIKKLLGLSGFYPIHPMTYIQARRNRKAATEDTEKQEEQEQSSSHA